MGTSDTEVRVGAAQRRLVATGTPRRRQESVPFDNNLGDLGPHPEPRRLDDVARILCAMASAAYALGEVDRCRDSVDAAEALLRERGGERASRLSKASPMLLSVTGGI